MLHIKKGKEPRSLAEYKNTATATYDDYREKDDVRTALLKEQHGLCAYCMCRINNTSNLHIEHYEPQSVSIANNNPAKTLDYNNMFGVCHGGRRNINSLGRKQLTCDAHRENTPLTVNPLIRSSVEKIKYLEDGTIYSDDQMINTDLNETLNLNHYSTPLRRSRKTTLDQLRKDLQRTLGSQKKWPKSRLQKLYNQYLEANPRVLFCGIILWYLEKHMR